MAGGGIMIGGQRFVLVPEQNVIRVRDRSEAKRIVRRLIDTQQVRGPDTSPEAQEIVEALIWGSMVLVREPSVPRLVDSQRAIPLSELAGSLSPEGAPPFEGAPGRAFISISLEEEDGPAVAGERYIIVPASGEDLHGDLDDAGEARHDGIAKGSASVSFPDRDRADWYKLGEVPYRGEGRLDVMLVSEDGRPAVAGAYEYFGDGTLVTQGPVKGGGRAYADVDPPPPEEFQLRASELRWWMPEAGLDPVDPKTVDGTFVCEFEDLLFNLNSPVMLPSIREDPHAPEPQDRITGLAVIATVLEFAEVNERQILVVGHTDTSGGRDFNMTLSGDRAATVLAVLRNDKSAWADVVTAKSYKVDWKSILKWVHDTFGWPCDPGPINEKNTGQARAARDAFRARAKGELGVEIPAGEQNRGDWEAYFDLYQRGLADLLGVEAEELATKVDELVYTEPASLACGELWPREQPGRDSFVSAANRRVELWLFESHEVPALEAEPPGVELYGPTTKLRPRFMTLRPRADRFGYELTVLGADEEPLAGATVRLSQDGIEFQVSTTDSIGRVFVEPPQAGEVAMTIDGHLVAGGPGTVEDAKELLGDDVQMERESESEPERVC